MLLDMRETCEWTNGSLRMILVVDVLHASKQ